MIVVLSFFGFVVVFFVVVFFISRTFFLLLRVILLLLLCRSFLLGRYSLKAFFYLRSDIFFSCCCLIRGRLLGSSGCFFFSKDSIHKDRFLSGIFVSKITALLGRVCNIFFSYLAKFFISRRSYFFDFFIHFL